MAEQKSLRNDVPRESYVQWYGKGRAQNWRTPRSLFDPLHDEFGFTMDGATEPGNELVGKASTAENPLPWEGERVFCNPPWSNIRPFVDLAATASLAVLLVPARTNAKWFHHALDLGAEVRYFAGRVKFERPDGSEGPGNSPVDCVLLVFHARPQQVVRSMTSRDGDNVIPQGVR